MATVVLKLRNVSTLINHRGYHTTVKLMAQRKVSVRGGAGGDLSINIEQFGKGPHPVLCLPGALGFIESDFGPILPKFSKDKYTLICWDPPGYGKSRPPDRDFSGGVKFFHRDAQWAKELMKVLGFPKFSMLGWSDGANTACFVAAKYPECVNKLVMWGGNAYIGPEDMKMYNRKLTFDLLVDLIGHLLKVKNIDQWSERMKAPMIKMYGEPYFREKWTAWIDAFTEIYEKDGGDLLKKDLSKIKCATFIIHGMKDAMVPPEHPEYFKKNIEKAKLHVFPEGKHNLHLKYADEFVQLVEQFLDEK